MDPSFGLKNPGNRGAWALVSAMAIVALLGYQQYRWIVRVAEAEEKTNREKLHAAVKSVVDDFDTEITRAHLALGGLEGISAADVLRKASLRLQEFRRLSEYPNLIASVDIAGGLPDPFSIDPGPPVALAAPAAIMQSGQDSRAGHYFAVQPFAGAEPQLHSQTASPVGFGGTPLRLRVVLDQDYIAGSLLPKLLDRHLGLNSRQHYDVLVRSTHTGAVVFRTGSATNQSWDESPPIFTIRSDCLMDEADRGAVSASSRVATSLAFLLRRAGKCGDVPAGLTGIWTLKIRARPNLAEAAAFARRQNLAISFGVLLVLAVTTATLFVSAHRARELASLHKQFAAGVSHELRTPLSVISSASENLADGVVESQAEVRLYGRMIHSHSEQLAGMIENALWFARKDGEAEVETEELDVEELLRAAAMTCGRALEQAGVALERDIEPHLPPIRGNRTLLLHGLQNLLTNIAHYARAGKWARIHAERRGNFVQFTIEDRGSGISPEETELVFQPFYRGQGARQANAAGLGLGLSLVKRIVEAHHGTIDLRSHRDAGTTIAFALPIVGVDESAR